MTVAALVLLTAGSALAASSRQIYADLADNGRLDGHYTQAELKNAALDATVQGYKHVASATRQQVEAQEAAQKSAPTNAGVLGATGSTGSTLPFTGVQLTVFVLVGLGLVLAGLLVRRSSREHPDS